MNPPETFFGQQRPHSSPTSDDDFPPDLWLSPRPTVLSALARNWLLVILPALVLAGAGVALAFSRPATYTAEAQLSVGKANLTSPAFGGFITATAELATVYSRFVYAPGVVNPTARKLGWSTGEVLGRLTATPIQDSPIIRVIGSAPSAAAAQAVANTAGAQLITYVTATNLSNPDAPRLLAQYRTLALQKARIDAEASAAGTRVSQQPGNASLKEIVARDTALNNELSVRLQSLSGAYLQSQAGQASTHVVSPLSNAGSASSNRSSRVQTLGGAGFLTGIVIGVALAMWRTNRLVRRHSLG